MYKSFEDLPVWKMALKLSKSIFNITSFLPKKEDYGLTSQIRRASNSVGTNIAEGFGRQGKKDKIQFYIYSKGSSYEVIHHLIYGIEVGYFDKIESEKIILNYKKVILELNKIIKVVEKWQKKR